MHSSKLRGSDFKIVSRGKALPHAAFFSSARETDRVGVISPDGVEGIGAITLLMAYVTAFYDRYRERTSEFFAYPDFFTFQRQTPCANYSMCDIWPERKNVHVPQDTQQTIESIVDRGVTVLLVPDKDPCEVVIAPVDLESAKRNIRRCFAYSETGTTESSNLTVECHSHLLRDYALAVLDSVPAKESVQKCRGKCLERMSSDTLSQSFREIELNEALSMI
ncbi:MAG: hypothetical protein OSB41_09515 [Kiritimatiellae bacterium]|nr:hypothetical protein [Kiritimatiellia bacterium]